MEITDDEVDVNLAKGVVAIADRSDMNAFYTEIQADGINCKTIQQVSTLAGSSSG